MSTWGISGAQFLLLYLVLFAVTVLGVVLARRRALASDGAAVPARLDPYEAAELNGGDDLVVITAASNLLRSGSLVNAGRRRGQPARLVTGPAPDPAAHPVEWAVYQEVATSPNRRLKDLRAELEQTSALAALRERLRLRGPAPTPEQRARCRAAALWFVPLLALGRPGWPPGRPTGGRSASWSCSCSSPWWSRPRWPGGSPTPPSWAGAPCRRCGPSTRGRAPGPPRPS